jgi:hypothetical protein
MPRAILTIRHTGKAGVFLHFSSLVFLPFYREYYHRLSEKAGTSSKKIMRFEGITPKQ